jgi:hypothetical protein
MARHYRPGTIFTLDLDLGYPFTVFQRYEATLKGPDGFKLRADTTRPARDPNRCHVDGRIPENAAQGPYEIVELVRRHKGPGTPEEVTSLEPLKGEALIIDPPIQPPVSSLPNRINGIG